MYIQLYEGPGFKSWRVSYFLFVPLRSFFLCYPGEALEGPISTGVSNELNNIDSNNGILISKILYIYIYNSKSLNVVQSLYFGSKLPSSDTYK